MMHMTEYTQEVGNAMKEVEVEEGDSERTVLIQTRQPRQASAGNICTGTGEGREGVM